jgi:WD40 repeat protein
LQEEPKLPVPDGCLAVFITGTTQQLFNIKTRTQITEEEPFRRIPKEGGNDSLLGDIQFRGAISDWQPYKDAIAKYPGPELLVYYDFDSDYGQNFVICISVEGEANIQKAHQLKVGVPEEGGEAKAEEGDGEPAEEPIEEAGEYKGPRESRPWESQGSEAEISEVTVVPNREVLVMSISRKRREFGLSNFKFTDTDFDYNEYRPYRDANFELRRMESDLAIQNVPVLKERHTQTAWHRKLNACIQYEPLEMESMQCEEHLESEAFREFLEVIEPRYTAALQQNETFDIISNDFDTMVDDDFALGSKTENKVKEYISYTTPSYIKKSAVSWVDWHPSGGGIVAVSCCDRLNLDERIDLDGKVRNSYLLQWNFADPILPQYMCEAPADLYCFRYNPQDPNIIAAGCVNGQVFIYDLRNASLNYQMEGAKKNSSDGDTDQKQTIPMVKFSIASSIDNSHKQPVSDIAWIPAEVHIAPRTGEPKKDGTTQKTQLVSIGADGAILIWDTTRVKDDGTWLPIHRVNLTNVDGTGELGGCQLAIDKEGSSKFYCATEEGELVFADWRTYEGDEVSEHVLSCAIAHFGPVHSLQRSPFFPDILLTVADWTFNIWKAGVQEPIISSPHANFYLRAGRWSPTRPGVLVTAKSDGSIDIWDLLDRSHEASMTVSIASNAIISLEFCAKPNPQLLAVGDDEGYLHVMDIPHNYRKSLNKEEKTFMQAFFDREVKRVEYQQKRLDFRRNELMEKRRELDQKREKEAEEEEKRRQDAEAAANKAADAEANKEANVPAPPSKEEEEEQRQEELYRQMEVKFCAVLGMDTKGNPLTEEELAALEMDAL